MTGIAREPGSEPKEARFSSKMYELANNRRRTPILWALDGKTGTPRGLERRSHVASGRKG